MAKGQASIRLAGELWSCITPVERRIVEAAGYGQRVGFGTRPALLIVDVTYGFCGRTPKPILQSITEQRRSCGEGAWKAVERIVPVLHNARAAKIPVIYSAMEEPSSPEYEPGLWGAKNRRGIEDGRSTPISNKGENDIVAEIAPAPDEMVFAKNKPSLFKDTGLLPYLIAHRIDSVLICGGATSGCVYATAVDAFSNNYKVAVIADASFDRLQTAHRVFLMDIDMKYGDVISSAATIEYLNSMAS